MLVLMFPIQVKMFFLSLATLYGVFVDGCIACDDIFSSFVIIYYPLRCFYDFLGILDAIHSILNKMCLN